MTIRHMIIESESILNPTLAVKSPETIQSKIFFLKSLASGASFRNSRKIRADTTKEAKSARQATNETTPLGSFRPEEAVDEEADAGITGMSQM